MIVFRGKVNFSVNLLTLPCFTLLFFLDRIEKFALFYFCAVFHEIAHIITAVIFKISVKEIEFLPFGLCIKTEDAWDVSCFKEIMLYFSGPLLNIIFGISGIIIGFLFPNTAGTFLKSFIEVNLFLAAFNLIPMFPLDGSRILMGILSLRIGVIKSAFLTLNISKILSVIFLIFSFLIFVTYNNFLLILLCCYIIWFLINCKESLIVKATLITISKEKHLKGENKPIKIIAVNENTFLVDLIKEIDRTRMLKVLIYDNYGSYCGYIKEQSIIAYMLSDGGLLTAGDAVLRKADKN